MTTIRKNSKLYKLLISSQGWTCYCLNNNFRGEAVSGSLDSERINKLYLDGDVVTAQVHSNCWYTCAMSDVVAPG